MPPKQRGVHDFPGEQKSTLPPIPVEANPTGFNKLFKPGKWFSRKPSNETRPLAASNQPASRPSTSSGVVREIRKVKISRPTDPRPILSSFYSDSKISAHASRSVADLSSGRSPNSMDISRSFPSQIHAVGHKPTSSKGNLQDISRRAWSKSVDDLSKSRYKDEEDASELDHIGMNHTPILSINTDFEKKVFEYRNRNGSTTPPVPPMPSSPSHKAPNPDQNTNLTSPVDSPPVPSKSPSTPLRPLPVNNPLTASHSAPAVATSPVIESPQTMINPPPRHHFPLARTRTSSTGSPAPKERETPPPLPSKERMSPSPSNMRLHPLSNSRLPRQSPAPSAFAEPKSDRGQTSKRLSQIVYQTGFLNRLGDGPAAQNAFGLTKAWKPYKVELKGARLCFFKPPNDRIAALKDCFTENTTDIEEIEEEDDIAAEGPQADLTIKIKKQRAWWSRGTHPDLHHDGAVIIHGSFEALVHEAVFATTFHSATGPQLDSDRAETSAYHNFASAILLALPCVAGATTFETEFKRCCSFYVSGADDEEQHRAKERISWLVTEYLDYREEPADKSSWETWLKETVPNFELIRHKPASPSSDAAESPSTPSSKNVVKFPLHPTQSPRFEDPNAGTLMQAFGTPVIGTSQVHSRIRTSLEQEGLTRSTFQSLDPQLLAESLQTIHCLAIDRLGSFTASTFSTISPSRPSTPPASATPTNDDYFFGTDDRPHWLTTFVMAQIFSEDLSSGGQLDTMRRNQDRPTQTSRTHSRSDMISVWAQIGELCRLSGDEASYGAIMAALCSRAVARMEKTWKRVSPDSRNIVRSWVYSKPAPPAQRVTPWGGNIKQRTIKLLKEAENPSGWTVRPMLEAKHLFDRLRTAIAQLTRPTIRQNEGVERLVKLWTTHAGSTSIPPHIDQYMTASFAAEQRRSGFYEPLFWTRLVGQRNTGQTSHLLPLQFYEPFPVIALGQMELTGLPGSEGIIAPNSRGLLDGTVVDVYDGELLLIVPPNQSLKSRPSSQAPSSHLRLSTTSTLLNDQPLGRTPSVRAKAAATQAVERKLSRSQKRSSLPSIRQRANEMDNQSLDTESSNLSASNETTLKAQVRAGTIPRLVHILLFGATVTVNLGTDDNGAPVKKEKELVVDQSEFSSVWWNSFRSFVSPSAFFDLLRKRYLGTSRVSITDSAIALAVSDRRAVLEVVKEWISNGGGAQDALDDPDLFKSLHSFLSGPQGVPIPSLNDGNPNAEIDEIRTKLACTFGRQTKRPSDSQRSHKASFTSPRGQSKDVPDIDGMDEVALIAYLDLLGASAWSSIEEVDLLHVVELLEVQTADCGWSVPVRDFTSAEDVEIVDFSAHLAHVDGSRLLSDTDHAVPLYKLLPPAIRSFYRAFGIVKKFLMFNLVAPRLGTRRRAARIELYLRALEILRAHRQPANLREYLPCRRTFCEAVLTAAIMSVESRAHFRAWQEAAAARDTRCDSLPALLTHPPTSKMSLDPLVVDLSWLLQRILEAADFPDVLHPDDGVPVVNIDKQRRIVYLVQNAPALCSSKRESLSSETLRVLEKHVATLQIDIRNIKEDAQREGVPTSGVGGSAKKPPRNVVFQVAVASQVDKNRRDRVLYDKISREHRLAQARTERKEEDPVKTIRKLGHRNKKSMSNVFFHFMRPISSAFVSEPLPTNQKKTAAQLDFALSGKPSLVVSIAGASVGQVINNDRLWVFRVDTDDGARHILQALSRTAMTQWFASINKVSEATAARRLTQEGALKPQLADHLSTLKMNAPRNAESAVFGVELQDLLKREFPDGVPPGSVPSILSTCLEAVEAKGLTEVGIYRIAGSSKEITALRDAFNRGENPIQSFTDVNAVCDLVKQWFRLLPSPIFPWETYHAVIDASKIEQYDERSSALRKLIRELPLANYDVLKRIMEHLDKVSEYEDVTQMSPGALSVVFSPNLLRAPGNDFSVVMANLGHAHKAVTALITQYHSIFDEIADEDEEDDRDNGDEEGDVENDNEDDTVKSEIGPVPEEDEASK